MFLSTMRAIYKYSFKKLLGNYCFLKIYSLNFLSIPDYIFASSENARQYLRHATTTQFHGNEMRMSKTIWVFRKIIRLNGNLSRALVYKAVLHMYSWLLTDLVAPCFVFCKNKQPLQFRYFCPFLILRSLSQLRKLELKFVITSNF